MRTDPWLGADIDRCPTEVTRLMTDSAADSPEDSLPNPNLKEQDSGIIEAFARSDDRVLTTSEIAENVTLSDRQVRRRLKELAERGTIGQRLAGGVRIAWLEEDVKEPITVQYPLLRYVRDRASVQFFLIGVLCGIIGALILLTAIVAVRFGLTVGPITNDRILYYGILAAGFSALFVVLSVITVLIEKAVSYLGIDIESSVKQLRD